MPPKKAPAAAAAGPKSLAGTKRKASGDVEVEAKKPKIAPPAIKPPVKSAPSKKAAAAKATKPAAKKPAAIKPPAKKAAPPTKAPAKKVTPPAKATGTKRKAESVVEDAPKAKKGKATASSGDKKGETKAKAVKEAAAKEEATEKKAKAAAEKKKAAKAAAPKKVVAPKPPKPAKVLPIINNPPTTKLDIYVFGENSAGELGLGIGKDPNGKSVVDVKRPRINHNLFADKVGVVQVAVGGMHCVALTHDNKIYTWGVNDQSALGRVTDSGPMKDIADEDADDSDSDDDAGANLNASEATPKEIDITNFPEGTKFASVYAGDSISFALTTTGLVYGWGTFRGNDGILGFRVDDKQANVPRLIPELKEIIEMACGTNHVLALTKKGKVFAWGAGEQNQLARRIMARSLQNGLVPREFGMGRKKIVKIGAGDYHSFVIDDKGVKYAWGLNTFGQTGVEKKFDTDDIVMQPTVISNLKDYDIDQIMGGAHHSIACTKDNKVLVWGRCDNHESGMEIDDIPKGKVFIDAEGKARYLEKPLELEMEGVCVSAAGDTCLVVAKDGVAWSWGFNDNYQAGQGQVDNVHEATEIDNSAIKGKKMLFGGLGGQFGVLGGESL